MVDDSRFSREARQVLAEAGDIAKRAGKYLDSSHLILAIFTVPCEAQSILIEKRLVVDQILDCLPIQDPEANETIGVIYSTAAQICANLGSRQVTSVHLLMAVSRIASSHAAMVLEKAGLPMFALRTHSMAHLTDPRLRRAATERLISTGGTGIEGLAPVVMAHSATDTKRLKGHGGLAAKAAVAPPPRYADDDDEPVEFAVDEPKAHEEKATRDEAPVVTTGPAEYRFALDPDVYPTLVSLGRNLTLEAEQGQLDPLIGRRKDLEVVVDVLCKRRANNPLLLGDPGVGKTALVEGLASLIVTGGDGLPRGLEDKIIVGLSVADMLAGTGIRGSFAARLKELKKEVLSADRRIILFIDEIHTMMGAGIGDGALDAANDLKGSLSRGEFPCIGATTFGEYQQNIQTDQALDRRFEIVTLREPSRDETDRIVEGVAPIYEKYHKVAFGPDALKASVRLTDRFISERSLPAKAIDLLDRAGARVGREGRNTVDRKDIVSVLAGLVDLPVEFLSVSPSDGLRGLDTFLHERVVGHDECLEVVSSVLSRNWGRFGSRRPLGSFVFAGPKGVGRRTTALAVSEFLFGSEQAFMDIDLSDFTESHSLSHLIGSPPGYVGHEEGGLLSDALTRRPFIVILWRNVERAHRSVQGLISQILKEGTATDRRGRRMDFRNTVHVLTAGLESDFDGESGSRAVGFGVASRSDGGPSSAALRARCRKLLPGDLVSTVDEIVAFRRLTPEAVEALARRLVDLSLDEFGRDPGVEIKVAREVMEAISSYCRHGRCDAGAIETAINRLFSRPASDYLYSEDVQAGRKVIASLGEPGKDAPTIVFRGV